MNEFPKVRINNIGPDNVFTDEYMHHSVSMSWLTAKDKPRPVHGPLTRYVKLQVAHAPGMPGTFSPAADF